MHCNWVIGIDQNYEGKEDHVAGGAEADAAAGEEEENVEVKQEEAKHDGNSESSRRITFLLHQLDILPKAIQDLFGKASLRIHPPPDFLRIHPPSIARTDKKITMSSDQKTMMHPCWIE